jgi:hypothetical protein
MSCGVGEVTSLDTSLSFGPGKGAKDPAEDEESPELSEEQLIREPGPSEQMKRCKIREGSYDEVVT